MTASTRTRMALRDRPEFASKPRPLTFPAETMASEAVAAMSDMSYGSVVVVDGDNKVTGIVTERDIMKKIVNAGRDAAKTPLSEIMTAEPRVARDTDEVVDWLRIMSNERFRRLPVVDENGRIKAVFTQGDFVSYTWPDLIYQAGQMAKASVFKNWHIALIGGGIALYSIIMVIVVATAT